MTMTPNKGQEINIAMHKVCLDGLDRMMENAPHVFPLQNQRLQQSSQTV